MITKTQQEFCRKVCALAREHGLDRFDGKFKSGLVHSIDDTAEVSFSWEQGRHGEDSNQIYINSVDHIHLKIDA